MVVSPTPRPVVRAQRDIGAHVKRWRKLQRLSAAQVADRAGVSRPVVSRLENGQGTTLENLLRIARALGVLDELTAALDPMGSDVGRLRADEQLPDRVRPRTTTSAPGELRFDGEGT